MSSPLIIAMRKSRQVVELTAELRSLPRVFNFGHHATLFYAHLGWYRRYWRGFGAWCQSEFIRMHIVPRAPARPFLFRLWLICFHAWIFASPLSAPSSLADRARFRRILSFLFRINPFRSCRHPAPSPALSSFMDPTEAHSWYARPLYRNLPSPVFKHFRRKSVKHTKSFSRTPISMWNITRLW